MMALLPLVALLTVLQASTSAQPPPTLVDFNALIATSTVRLSGQCATDTKAICFGTAFFVGRPTPGTPNEGAQVLVSAAHVLNDIGSDFAEVLTRVKNDDGSYTRKVVPLRIRERGSLKRTGFVGDRIR